MTFLFSTNQNAVINKNFKIIAQPIIDEVEKKKRSEFHSALIFYLLISGEPFERIKFSISSQEKRDASPYIVCLRTEVLRP